MKIAKDPAEVGSMVDFVPFFKALCNSTRAQIIEFLLSGERCVCEMTGPLDVSQPLVSHHLALLRDAGLLKMRDEGTRTYYSIAWDRFDGDLDGFPRARRASAQLASRRERRQRLCHETRSGEAAQRIVTATTTTRRDT